jgi:hypothetical protein
LIPPNGNRRLNKAANGSAVATGVAEACQCVRMAVPRRRRGSHPGPVRQCARVVSAEGPGLKAWPENVRGPDETDAPTARRKTGGRQDGTGRASGHSPISGRHVIACESCLPCAPTTLFTFACPECRRAGACGRQEATRTSPQTSPQRAPKGLQVVLLAPAKSLKTQERGPEQTGC